MELRFMVKRIFHVTPMAVNIVFYRNNLFISRKRNEKCRRHIELAFS